MQSIDNLMDAVAKYLSDSKPIPGEFLFSKIDLKYAYSQIPLHPTIQNIVTLTSSGVNLQALPHHNEQAPHLGNELPYSSTLYRTHRTRSKGPPGPREQHGTRVRQQRIKLRA